MPIMPIANLLFSSTRNRSISSFHSFKHQSGQATRMQFIRKPLYERGRRREERREDIEKSCVGTEMLIS